MEYITISNRGEVIRVSLKDINYINKEGRKICIHTSNEVLMFYGYIREVIPNLDDRFYKCHGYLIINFDKIERFGDREVRFINEDSVFIGIHNLRMTKNNYKTHLENKFK